MRHRTAKLAFFTLVATSILVPFLACGADDQGSGPPPLGTEATPKPEPVEDAAPPVTDAELEAATTATTYKGTLATTKTTKFGGDPYCGYTMTIRQIEIEILVLDGTKVGLSRVKNLAVETSVPPCPHPPMENANQEFALAGATKTATGFTVKLVGAKSNRPTTSLVLDLVTKGDGFDASAQWKRVDQKAPLDWTVSATIPLARQ